MAVLSMQFYSRSLKSHTVISAVLPSETSSLEPDGVRFYEKGKKYQVLYLLHGATGDCNVWLYNTKIAFYAQQRKLAVIFASVQNSFYVDMKYGPAYHTFLTEELPQVAKAFFPISERTENTFIGGISMGGYGAVLAGLSKPEQYGRIGSISGVLDVVTLTDGTSPVLTKEMVTAAFGEHPSLEKSEYDLMERMRNMKTAGIAVPPVYQCCGTEDFLYSCNLRCRDAMKEAGVELTYEEGPGAHEWEYWDKAVCGFLDWLPLKRKLVEE